MSLDRLAEAVRLCEACPLGTMGRGVPGMWYVVDPAAPGGVLWKKENPGFKTPQELGGYPDQDRVMILGEAPGGVEMARGQPFVGGSGQLLHSLLKEAGMTRYYVSNIAKHQPPKVKGKQQAPDKVVIEACAPFLRAEFDLVKPAKLILLGKTAAKLIVPANFSMKDVVNTTHLTSPTLFTGPPAYRDTISVLVLYHPAHFLYNRTAPWIQKQISEWKRSVQMFLGDRPPEYKIEQVECAAHPHCCGSEPVKSPGCCG